MWWCGEVVFCFFYWFEGVLLIEYEWWVLLYLIGTLLLVIFELFYWGGLADEYFVVFVGY